MKYDTPVEHAIEVRAERKKMSCLSLDAMFEFCPEEFGFAWIAMMVLLRQFHMLNVGTIARSSYFDQAARK